MSCSCPVHVLLFPDFAKQGMPYFAPLMKQDMIQRKQDMPYFAPRMKQDMIQRQ